MIEKRKKLTIHTEEEHYHDHDDVEEYENKKSTFRHKWGYFAIAALLLVVMYMVYQQNQPMVPVSAKPSKLTDLLADNIAKDDIKVKTAPTGTYTVKTAQLNISQNNTPKTTNKPAERNTQPAPHPVDTAAVKIKEEQEMKQNLRKQAAVSAPGEGGPEAELQASVDAQLAKIRHMKFQEHIVMEKDENAKIEIAKLQDMLRKLLRMQYGPGPYRVEMKLQFPQSMAQPVLPQEQSIIIDLAPINLVPYSVYYFLELVKHWKNGAFHRNAGHVLQAQASTDLPGGQKGLAFQEYHPDFPHKQYTMGYAGRPGGPAFYISTVNNVANHGPASQGSASEADSCFGRIQPQSLEVVKRMQQQPGAAKPMGFVSSPKNHIKIVSLKVLNQA